MKFYDFTLAPNPRRVRMFMAEKGIALPETIQVNTREREQFADWFQAHKMLGSFLTVVTAVSVGFVQGFLVTTGLGWFGGLVAVLKR